MLMASMSINDRRANMARFEEGTTNVIATTNLLSRGVNFDDIAAVINYELAKNRSNDPSVSSYLYRSSRCGRFGSKGVCISFGGFNEIRKLENAANIKIQKIEIWIAILFSFDIFSPICSKNFHQMNKAYNNSLLYQILYLFDFRRKCLVSVNKTLCISPSHKWNETCTQYIHVSIWNWFAFNEINRNSKRWNCRHHQKSKTIKFQFCLSIFLLCHIFDMTFQCMVVIENNFFPKSIDEFA